MFWSVLKGRRYIFGMAADIVGNWGSKFEYSNPLCSRFRRDLSVCVRFHCKAIWICVAAATAIQIFFLGSVTVLGIGLYLFLNFAKVSVKTSKE
jgi:hypothetical protein